MAIAAGISAGGALLGAGISASATSSAANKESDAAKSSAQSQLQAAQLATNTQEDIYGQTKATLAPFVTAGTGALTQLQSLLGLNPSGAQGALSTLQNLPGYQFNVQQGQQALDRSAASRGMLLSGGQVKDSQAFGQGLASSQFNSYLSPLLSIYGTGESAGAQQGAYGAQTGASIANTITGGANNAAQTSLAGAQAAAAGQIGGANAIAGGLNSALNNSLFAYNAFGGGGGGSLSSINDFASGAISGLNIPYEGVGGYTLSDARLKTDIRRVGRTDEGLGVYTYRLKSGGPKQMGVLAQEAEKIRPEAVRNIGGVKMVHYGKISPLAAHIKMAA